MRLSILEKPSWKLYYLACLPYLCGVIAFVKSFRMGADNPLWDVYLWLGVLAVVVGHGLVELTSHARQLALAHEEARKQADIDNERIWKLEAALAELKRSDQPTH